MILTEEQIRQHISEPQNGKLIEQGREYYKKLNRHLNGTGIAAYLEQVKKYENEDQFGLRVKYVKSNRYIFSNILRPLDKIFYAKGGSITYGLKEEQEKILKDKLSNVRFGYSVRKWLENIWLKKYHSDPNGVIYIEVSKADKDKSYCYPTYKSINVIHDFESRGQDLEYLIFIPEEKMLQDLKIDVKSQDLEQYDFRYFRVIDDATDTIYELKQNKKNKESELRLIDTKSIVFDKLPAKIISDLISDNGDIKLSPIDDSIEIADEILWDDSVKRIYKMAHGFPSYWEYSRDCKKCKGSGYIDGVVCDICHGTGDRQSKDVSDITIVDVQTLTKEINPVPPCGYVSPDLPTWDQMNIELDKLKKDLHYAIWGTHQVENERNETATARYLDFQPVVDKLNKYSDATEIMYKFIVDIFGAFYLEGIYKEGCTVNMGRRYQIETPDQIWIKFQEAREKGAPAASLKYLYMQWLQSEFANDTIELMRQEKLFNIEPHPFVGMKELKDVGAPEEEYNKKLYWQEWISSVKDGDIITLEEEKLKELFTEFINTKNKAKVEKPKPVVIIDNLNNKQDETTNL